MSIKALDWAMDTKLDDPLAKLVLIVIANHHNQSHGYAWPSVGHICDVTCASEATVRRKICKLEDLLLIKREYRVGRSNHYYLSFKPPVTVIPLSEGDHPPVTVSPITLKEPLNKNKAKTKLIDWQPDINDKSYAKDLGLNAESILEGIRLWDQQNGNKAAYVDCSAFWKNWCRKEAERKPKRVAGRSKPHNNNYNNQTTEWTPPQRKMVTAEEWKNLSENMRTYYRQNRPDVIAELKKIGEKV